MLSRLLRGQGLVVPEVLAIDTSGGTWPVRYLITSFVPGRVWAEAHSDFADNDRAALLAELGHAVARIHALDFPAFGDLGRSGDVVDPGTYVQALTSRARRRIANPRHVELFQSLLEAHHRELSDVGPPALTARGPELDQPAGRASWRGLASGQRPGLRQRLGG